MYFSKIATELKLKYSFQLRHIKKTAITQIKYWCCAFFTLILNHLSLYLQMVREKWKKFLCMMNASLQAVTTCLWPGQYWTHVTLRFWIVTWWCSLTRLLGRLTYPGGPMKECSIVQGRRFSSARSISIWFWLRYVRDPRHCALACSMPGWHSYIFGAAAPGFASFGFACSWCANSTLQLCIACVILARKSWS